MAPPVIMAKAALQQRLLATVRRGGHQSPADTRLHLRDVSAFIGVKRPVLSAVAHKKQELDDALQVQLSSFFMLWESGRIVKEVVGQSCELRRIVPPPGETEPPRATIDVHGMFPRINWNWSRHP